MYEWKYNAATFCVSRNHKPQTQWKFCDLSAAVQPASLNRTFSIPMSHFQYMFLFTVFPESSLSSFFFPPPSYIAILLVD